MNPKLRKSFLPLSAVLALMGVPFAVQAQETETPEVKVFNITSYGYVYDLAKSGETIAFGKLDLKKTAEKTYYLQVTNARPEQVSVTSTDGRMFDPSVSTVPSQKQDKDGKPYYEFKVAAHSGNEEGDFTGTVTVSVAGGNSLDFTTTLTVMNLSKETIADFKQTALEVGWNAEVNYTGAAVINNVEYVINPNTGLKSGIKAFIGDSTGDICLEISRYDPEVQPGRHVNFTSHTSSRDLDNASWPCVAYTLKPDSEWTHPTWSELADAPEKADVGKYVSVKGCVFSEQTSPGSDGKYYMTFKKGNKDVKCVVPNNLNNYFNGLPDSYKTGEVEIIGSVTLDIIDWNKGNETFIIPRYIRNSAPDKALKTGEWLIESQNLTAGRSDKWKAQISATDDPFVYEIEKLIDNKDGKTRMILSPEGNALDIMTGEMFRFSETYLQTWEDGDDEGERIALGRGANIRLLVGSDEKVTNPGYIGYIYKNDAGSTEFIWDKNSTWTKYEAPSFTINEYQPWGLTVLESESEISLRRTSVGRSYTDSSYRVLLSDDTAPSDLTFTVADPSYFRVGLSEPKDDRGTYYSLLLTLLPQNEAGTYATTFTVADKAGKSQTFSLKAEVLDLRCPTIKEFKEKAVTMRLGDEVVYTGTAHVNVAGKSTVYASDETGSIVLSCLPEVSEGIEQGMYVSFTGSAVYISGKPEDDVKYPSWKCMSMERKMDLYPTWKEPERVTLTTTPTLEDCGKYVSVKNVTFKSESIDYLSGMFAREDGTNDLWYEFVDEQGNIYNVHPLEGSANRYGFGIPEEFKATENPVKLEIVGYCFGGSRTNGYPQPYINPQYIRTVEPKNPLPEGEWEMNAYSIMYDTQENPWTVTVTQDPENPYIYMFQDFVYGNGRSSSSDRHCIIKGELDDTCKELHIISGEPFDLEQYNESVECWFAFVDQFDRTGATPEQEPMRRGTEAVCPREDNKITIPVGFSYTVYGNIWTDPEHIYWGSRWSHFGLWKGGAELKAVIPYPVPQNLTATVEDTSVNLKWDPVTSSEYELTGYAVYYNDNLVDKTAVGVTEYTVNNVRGKARFKVTALFGEDESKPSNEVEVQVTGLEGISDSAVSVNAVDGGIEIAAGGAEARIVSTIGTVIYSGRIDGTERIATGSGIFIVSVNGHTYKLMVK